MPQSMSYTAQRRAKVKVIRHNSARINANALSIPPVDAGILLFRIEFYSVEKSLVPSRTLVSFPNFEKLSHFPLSYWRLICVLI